MRDSADKYKRIYEFYKPLTALGIILYYDWNKNEFHGNMCCSISKPFLVGFILFFALLFNNITWSYSLSNELNTEPQNKIFLTDKLQV